MGFSDYAPSVLLLPVRGVRNASHNSPLHFTMADQFETMMAITGCEMGQAVQYLEVRGFIATEFLQNLLNEPLYHNRWQEVNSRLLYLYS